MLQNLVKTKASEIEKWITYNLDANFWLAKVTIDHSTKRRSHRGGYYCQGPGINISLSLIEDVTYKEWFFFGEYKSYNDDPEIGHFYSNDIEHYVSAIISHEMAHAYQRFREKWYELPRSAPHGQEFQNIYRTLRKQFVNPFIPEKFYALEQYVKNAGRLKKHS